jgi:hypothetical protein
VSNIELMWEEPGLARFLDRLASFSRLILFDNGEPGCRIPSRARSFDARTADGRRPRRHGRRPEIVPELAPSKVGDEAFEQWIGRYLRQSASPRATAALLRMNSMIDVRAVLPSIRVPALLLYRTGRC